MRVFHYFLVTLIVMLSGNPVFTVHKVAYPFVFMLFALYWFLKPLKIRRGQALFFIIIGSILLWQLAAFGTVVLAATANMAAKIGIALLGVLLIPRFFEKYVRVMAWLAVISLPFYIAFMFDSNAPSTLSFLQVPLRSADVIHIGIHNFHLADPTRNCGLFWEPGAFAGYLALALLLITANETIEVRVWQVWALIVALISTQSTTGYVAAIVLLALYVARRTGSLPHLLLIMPLATALAVAASIGFNQIPFLGNKIKAQIEAASDMASGAKLNRFGNFIYDIKFFWRRPLAGWGVNPETRIRMDPEVEELLAGQGNGFSGFLVRFGLFGLLTYLSWVFFTARDFSGSVPLAGVFLLVIVILLFGEQFLNFPMFFTIALARSSVASQPRGVTTRRRSLTQSTP